ncbi:sensor histidine kinase [Croceicoccus gelatinilyticus]|uniref:sensor histidine kinase n=1 Tax=Croceicoccus gelatinilyticus TaxID=2835536 RepID=UPI001BCEC77C|nr:histidine kinase dimerization/phospho-acceptor domain-containing protein [Croceicoccus gelatinilyticus]MBS7668254.1 HAMP domain-containing histidine kinase [Croceicoccus gelatinilyticus]
MTLDDRLRTVLEVAADSDASARAQYQQLVDLLGSGRTVADGSLVAASFLRLAALARRIPAFERAQILADPALRLRSAPLVAQLCEGEEEVANAAIDAADLDEAGWTVLTSVLDDSLQNRVRSARTTGRARSVEAPPPLLAERSKKRTSLADELTPSAPVPARAPRMPAPPPPPTPMPTAQAETPAVGDIAEIVARIERFRLKRREQVTEEIVATGRKSSVDQDESLLNDEAAETAPPPIATTREVDCMISPEGRIDWAARLSPMLTGLMLSPSDSASAKVDEATSTALRRQQAVRSGRVTIGASPAISGVWRLDAAPHFDPVGRFLGHHARLTRDMGSAPDRRGDLVRQALHELRTPINALQGFSEIIQQQLFGPVPHQYRSLAAGIAGETAALLAGLEEVDRLVRLRHGTRTMSEGETAIGPLIESLLDQVAPMLDARRARLSPRISDPGMTVPVDEGELERSLWRLIAAVAGSAREGDVLPISLDASTEAVTITIGMPASLAGLDDETLFGASPATDSNEELATGMLGRGFALRLASAEAKAAGGNLERDESALVLTLPARADEAESEREAVA